MASVNNNSSAFIEWSKLLVPSFAGGVIASVLLKNPLGLMWGGVFYTSTLISAVTIQHLKDSCIGVNRRTHLISDKALPMILASGITWKLALLAGFSLTFSQVAVLTLVSFLCDLGIRELLLPNIMAFTEGFGRRRLQ